MVTVVNGGKQVVVMFIFRSDLYPDSTLNTCQNRRLMEGRSSFEIN